MYFWDKHKTITSYYELLSGEVCERYELTQMEYDILMFLHNNPQHNTAAEIVKVRKSTKSHVSTSLKKLENKELVERKQSKDNKKHIEIFWLNHKFCGISDSSRSCCRLISNSFRKKYSSSGYPYPCLRRVLILLLIPSIFAAEIS